jgi:hypothetical protein
MAYKRPNKYGNPDERYPVGAIASVINNFG